MKVSVIIAAYNAQKYLAETLDSVLHQTIDEYEVIVVDDGSTDSTPAILQDYAERFPRLRVLRQSNSGPSAARNYGMQEAAGEYFYFLDADDILVEDALEALYNRAEEQQADLVIARYDTFNQYGFMPVINLDEIVVLDRIDRYEQKILWTFALWNKLFRADKIREHNWKLPPVSYSEDGVFVMNYVLHADHITGLDHLILHYRRMTDGQSEAITASVAPWKVRDYIQAHRMILALIERSMLDTFGAEGDLAAIRQAHPELDAYINEFLRKEVHVLERQFYGKFWSLDGECIRMLSEQIHRECARMDLKTLRRMQNALPDIPLTHVYASAEEILSDCLFTAVLYGSPEEPEAFLESLESLCGQIFARMKIIVPSSMRALLQTHGREQANLFYLPQTNREELYLTALQQADTPYILFAEGGISYMPLTLFKVFKGFASEKADYYTGLVHVMDPLQGNAQPIDVSEEAMNELEQGLTDSGALTYDHTLANKFFRTEFLRELPVTQRFISGGITPDMTAFLQGVRRRGYTRILREELVIYTGREEAFPSFCGAKSGEEMSLSDEIFAPEYGRALRKLQTMPTTCAFEIRRSRIVKLFQKLPIRRRTLFFSIRADGQLEGNAKALYPYVKGRKVIAAKRLPHDKFYKLYMYYLTATSKVIVTDDYVRYLRNIRLRPGQRVVQLWHACGAFKKFGQDGTNLSVATDLATHAQYSLVTVSGRNIRQVYAGAFDVSLRKVQDLGSPRTDLFFDETYKEQVKEQLYKAHPELAGKEILLYAPTFRENKKGKGRGKFKPQLDFDRLSEELLENQMLIICPHPLMKNAIIPHAYDNIQVLRDYSTNDYMLISDLLITDYSSVIFEYALLHKPMAFYCYDLDKYNREFYLRYPEDLPGEIYRTQEELTAFLHSPRRFAADEKLDRFIEGYMGACDGRSSERIAAVINRYLGRK